MGKIFDAINSSNDGEAVVIKYGEALYENPDEAPSVVFVKEGNSVKWAVCGLTAYVGMRMPFNKEGRAELLSLIQEGVKDTCDTLLRDGC